MQKPKLFSFCRRYAVLSRIGGARLWFLSDISPLSRAREIEVILLVELITSPRHPYDGAPRCQRHGPS
jgi:hypothetical protein